MTTNDFLQLLRPEFAHLLAREDENEIFDLIGRLIQTLSSNAIAIDDRHTPKLYARFLAGLLSRHRRDGATVGRLHPQPPPHQLPSPDSNGYPHNLPSVSTFAVSHPQGSVTGHGQDLQHGYGHSGYNQAVDQIATPIYRPEATYAVGAGPIQFGGDLEMLNFDGNSVSDEEMLATMQAIKNPAWWQNMMMPGFVFFCLEHSTTSDIIHSDFHGRIPGRLLPIRRRRAIIKQLLVYQLMVPVASESSTQLSKYLFISS